MNISKIFKKIHTEAEVTIKLTWLLKIGALIILFVGLCVFVFLYSKQSSVKGSLKKESDIFYYSNIKGRIRWYEYNVPFYFRVEGSDSTFTLFEGKGLNTNLTFSSVIHIEDSIIKPSESDTITIIKPNGEIFYFLFI